MSLATRCPACGTIFRVVQDQLKVSEGWVRCGQCHEVFHGIEALFDLDSDPTIAARRTARQPVAAPPPTRVFAQQRADAPIPSVPASPPVEPPAPTPAAVAPRPAAPPESPAPQSVPATPSAFGSTGTPAPSTIRPGYTGFTPATRPMPPAPDRPAAPAPQPILFPPAPSPVPQVATRSTIAPRFAARLAEEAARAQAATAAASQPSAIVVTPPVTASPPRALPSAQVPLEVSPAASAPVPAFKPSAPAPLSTPSAPTPLSFTATSATVPPVKASAPAPLSTPSALAPSSTPRSPIAPFKPTAPAPLFKPTTPATLATPSAPAPFSVATAPMPISAPEDFDLGPLDAPPLDAPALPGHFAPTAPMSLDALTELAPLVPLSPPPGARPSASMPLGAPSGPMPFGTRPSAPVPLGTPSAPVPFGTRPSAPMPLGTPSAPAPFDFARRTEEAASRWQTQPMSLQPRTSAPVPAAAPAAWFAPPAASEAAPAAEPALPKPATTPAAWFAPPPARVPTATPTPAAVPAATAAAESVPAPAPAPEPIYIPPSIAARRPEAESAAPVPAVPVEPTRPVVPPTAVPTAADLAADFAAPTPALPPQASAPPEAEASVIDEFRELGDLAGVEIIEPAPEVGGSTMPSRLADDLEEERRAGPPTLASMLPEDAGEWPPRKTKKRKDKEAAAGATESVLVDKTKDPRFLREARSGARWRKPWVRATLGLLLLLLVVAAAAQVAWPLRDTIAARWPVTQPAWAWVCEQADCRIEAPRAIASLALDGSSLTRTDTEHVLLFAADLHNRADHEVLMPSFDVSFMDLNGAIVARKVLSPEQLGIHQASLPPLGELHVHARLQVGALPASGFQADLFYP